jgi:hypothetical protein
MEMQLDEFVRETILQIIQGVKQAQEQSDRNRLGALVSPFVTRSEGTPGGMLCAGDRGAMQVVEFDIAIAVTKGNKAKGGAGLVIGPLVLGARGASEAQASTVSRVKFSVPVSFPLHSHSEPPRQGAG